MTEYHYHDSSGYTIEVEYFAKDRLLKQFKELLRAYRRFHLHPTEDAAEKKDLEEASFVAWHTFKAAFNNQPVLTRAYILQQDEGTLLNNMSSWIDQFAPRGHYQAGHSPNVRRESIANEVACRELLGQLTSKPLDPSAAASWPYIERVKYDSAQMLVDSR